MSKLSISIALCTYNGERFLQEQLDSLAAQTRLPDEVVVGDDGSTDRTLEILEQWAETVPFPVRIQRNELQLGCTNNFLSTARRSSGDVVFFCDQDDVWLPDKLAKMMRVFEEQPDTGLVYCDGEIINQDSEDLHTRRSDLCIAYMFSISMPLWNPYTNMHYNLAGCCSAFRRKLVEPYLNEPVQIEHDVWLYCQMLPRTKCVTLHEPLILYRVHDRNVSLPDGWFNRYSRDLAKQKTFYQWSVGSYWGAAKSLEKQIEEYEFIPEKIYAKPFIKYIRNNQRHYPNRGRVQRNFFLFFPLFLLEVFTGRYFQRSQPFRSMAYDVWTGVKNGLNPIKTLELAGSVFRKIGRKIHDH